MFFRPQGPSSQAKWFQRQVQEAFDNPLPPGHPGAETQRLLRAAGRLLDDVQNGSGEIGHLLSRYDRDPNRPRTLAGWLELVADHVEGNGPEPPRSRPRRRAA